MLPSNGDVEEQLADLGGACWPSIYNDHVIKNSNSDYTRPPLDRRDEVVTGGANHLPLLIVLKDTKLRHQTQDKGKVAESESKQKAFSNE